MNRIRALGRQPLYLTIGLFFLLGSVLSLDSGMPQTLLPKGSLFFWQVATGAILLGLVAYQWVLLGQRLGYFQKSAASQKKRHQWMGVTTLLIFALHAISFGYNWNSFLVVAFIATAVTGLMNKEVINYQRRWVYLAWFWTHAAFATVLIPLIALHIWTALAFKA